MNEGGLRVMCAFCKKTKVLSWKEAEAVKDIVMCPCGGPMVAHSAVRKAKK